MAKSIHTNLTKELGIKLGYHRNVVASLIKRNAIIIDGIVYAPIKKRAKDGNK